jgi:hypothetical protein
MAQRKAVRVLAAVVVLSAFLTCSAAGQESTSVLSGTVTDASGKGVTGAKVSALNLVTGQTSEAGADENGYFSFSGMPAGEYEITASAEGSGTSAEKVTLTTASPQTLNLTLSQAQKPSGSENLPNAPSASKPTPSLDDLGFPAAATQANAAEQALLDKRSHMLKIHQRMGLITAGPLVATLIASVGAGGKSTSTSSRDLHVALGALTGDLYGITAYYAIRAPRIKGTETRGPIKVHKALAWVHGPGMILTPILGAMAFDQKSNGEKVHGIASAHGPVAIVTAGAFGAAMLAVSVKF